MEKKLTGCMDGKGGFAEERAEKRKRFDKIQVVEVSTDEAKRIPRDRGFKENVLNWLKPKGVYGLTPRAKYGRQRILASKAPPKRGPIRGRSRL